MTDPLSIALSGLNAATARANAAASNIANAGTVGATPDGNGPPPYTPVDVVQTSTSTQNGQPQGVKTQYAPRKDATSTVYEPDSPYADDKGEVATPNVDTASEIVNLKEAASAYKANIAVVNATNDMEKELFDRFDQTV